MDFIKGHCRTNLDDYRMIVDRFYKVPEVGEKVVCERMGYRTELYVCQVTHDIEKDKPYIIVELTNSLGE